jgi:hypothetical protein
VQNSTNYRIKKCLGQFRLAMAIEQAHVVALDSLPDRIAERSRLKLVLQSVERFLNPQAVKINSLSL